MKKLIFLGLVVIFTLLLSSVSFANYGVHGKPENTAPPFFGSNYENVWECAGCHRGHTGSYTNLLFTTMASTWGFCSSCHGASGTGANNNVEEGVYSTARGRSPSVPADSSTPGGPLNGGGFLKLGGPSGNSSTSRHDAYLTDDATLYTAWGSSDDPSTAVQMRLTCTSCHNPHGSTNYRILEDLTPPPVGSPPISSKNTENFVDSNETGFETGSYSPDYTTPSYKAPLDLIKGASGWCIACHTKYLTRTSGGKFRHTVNAKIRGVTGSVNGRLYNLTTSLPLAKENRADAQDDPDNLLICLTCHRAHGTDKMVALGSDVSPAGGSTLLRLNNRGVCQDCHKK